MHEDVKKYADSNDIKGLRYIFVDCLDVDPTFEKYAEDFEYCKNKAGLFEPHKELTPITENQRLWNEDYWVQLKMDLLKNFSRERFGHMRQVAQVMYADKIEKITAEREEQARRLEEKRRQLEQNNQSAREEEQKEKEQLEKMRPNRAETILSFQGSAQMQENTTGSVENAGRSQSEEQARRLEEKRRQLEQNNQRAREEERKQKERLEKMRSNRVEPTASSMENFDSKKVVGVVLVVVIIVIIILIVMAM